jgi:CheY-like chemotaxis protein/anti-anti-sigma regulatory factor
MRTILVIDDERPTLDMFALHLEAYGHRVLTAQSGEEGLALFDAQSPDIVLTDIRMPGLDGLAVLEAIKERRPQTEVIVITGHGDIDLALAALELRATDFIDKPIRRELLEAALNRAGGRLDRAAQAGPDADITADRDGEVGVVSIRGSLDSRRELFLSQAFAAVGTAPKVLFAFDGHASVNGAGFDLLLGLVETCRLAGRPVAIGGLAAHFAKVLDRFGITAMAPRFASREQALAHLQGIGANEEKARDHAPCLGPSRA